MSLLTNFQDLARTVKLALDRKADKSELALKADKSELATKADKSEIPTLPEPLVLTPLTFVPVVDPQTSLIATGTFDKTNTEILEALADNRNVTIDFAPLSVTQAYYNMSVKAEDSGGRTYPDIYIRYSYIDGDDEVSEDTFKIIGTPDNNAFDLYHTHTVSKGTITSGSTGYATGGDVYTELQSIPSMPSGTNTGDILEWDGDKWVTKPKWQMIYQPCEWIEGGANVYFDTEYIANSNSLITAEISITTGTVDKFLFGSRQSFKTKDFSLFYYGPSTEPYNSTRASYGTGDAYFINSLPLSKTKYQLGNGNLYVNDTLVHTFATTYDFVNKPIYIFCVNNNGSALDTGSNIKMKLYSFKIEENGNIIENFVPCYDIYTGKIGLFETVAQKFYSNKSSGTLTHGNDIN